MVSLHSHQAFDLVIYKMKEWNLPAHKHHFFELVYVLEGKGTHIVNNNGYGYGPGSLYLLTPHDEHSFEIEEESKFCIVVITEIYFSMHGKNNESKERSMLFQQLEYIFLNSSNFNGEPVTKHKDREWVDTLMKKLIYEVERKALHYENIVQNLISVLLNQIARAISENQRMDHSVKHSDNIYDIMSYIQRHIYEKDKLRVDAIANTFLKSKNYINEYFKEQTGETIKEYILKYKMNLVRSRLIHSDLTVAQIADELAFTDASHLNKIFREHEGITPKTYRNQHSESKLNK